MCDVRCRYLPGIGSEVRRGEREGRSLLLERIWGVLRGHHVHHRRHELLPSSAGEGRPQIVTCTLCFGVLWLERYGIEEARFETRFQQKKRKQAPSTKVRLCDRIHAQREP